MPTDETTSKEIKNPTTDANQGTGSLESIETSSQNSLGQTEPVETQKTNSDNFFEQPKPETPANEATAISNQEMANEETAKVENTIEESKINTANETETNTQTDLKQSVPTNESVSVQPKEEIVKPITTEQNATIEQPKEGFWARLFGGKKKKDTPAQEAVKTGDHVAIEENIGKQPEMMEDKSALNSDNQNPEQKM